jgi:hypothetical protein
MSKPKTKRQKPQPLDFFAVPLRDGTYGLGQLRELTDDGQSILLYRTRAKSPEELAELARSVAATEAVGALTIGTLELARGDWRIVGNAGEQGGVSALHRPPSGTSYSGETVDGFLEAFHGLRPWDEFPRMPDWYGALLLPNVKPPPNRVMRDAPPKEKAKPATPRHAEIPDGEGELHVEILYEGDGLPDVPLLRKRQALESWIEGEGLGEVTDAGGGGGVLDIFVQTKDARRAAAAIESKLAELGWRDVSSLGFTPEASERSSN